MSADATVWQDERGWWHGQHDGPCPEPLEHRGTAYELAEVIEHIQHCYGAALDWEIRQYKSGFGLDGRQARSGRR